MSKAYAKKIAKVKRANKIVVVGLSGAGKSTFASKLAPKLNLPVIHSEPLCYNANWTRLKNLRIEQEWENAAQGSKWIFEGGLRPTTFQFIFSSDVLILLDVPLGVRYFRAVKRDIKSLLTFSLSRPHNAPIKIRRIPHLFMFRRHDRNKAKRLRRIFWNNRSRRVCFRIKNNAEATRFLENF